MSDKDLLIETLQIQLEMRDREIEVLTAVRDKALRRIEELERTHTDKWDRIDAETVVPDWNDSPRGGVNPNA